MLSESLKKLLTLVWIYSSAALSRNAAVEENEGSSYGLNKTELNQGFLAKLDPSKALKAKTALSDR